MQSDLMDKIHNMYMTGICVDIINGKLLTETNNDELHMILTEIYDDMTAYEQLGVTIGKAQIRTK